ncbi:MAG: hypothetical protein QW228_08050 [Candidatus Aenigmatarchaeota archaeon]
MVKMEKTFESVSIRKELVNKIKEYIQKSGNYRSVAEFVSEAIRLRLEQLSVKESEVQ